MCACVGLIEDSFFEDFAGAHSQCHSIPRMRRTSTPVMASRTTREKFPKRFRLCVPIKMCAEAKSARTRKWWKRVRELAVTGVLISRASPPPFLGRILRPFSSSSTPSLRPKYSESKRQLTVIFAFVCLFPSLFVAEVFFAFYYFP